MTPQIHALIDWAIQLLQNGFSDMGEFILKKFWGDKKSNLPDLKILRFFRAYRESVWNVLST